MTFEQIRIATSMMERADEAILLIHRELGIVAANQPARIDLSMPVAHLIGQAPQFLTMDGLKIDPFSEFSEWCTLTLPHVGNVPGRFSIDGLVTPLEAIDPFSEWITFAVTNRDTHDVRDANTKVAPDNMTDRALTNQRAVLLDACTRAPGAQQVADQYGRLMSVSAGWADLFGLLPSAVIGMPVSHFMTPVLQTTDDAGPVTFAARHSSGRCFDVSVTSSFHPCGPGLMNWSILEDQTPLRRSEEANISLKQFADNAAHDLRAPLRHVGFFTGLIGEHLDETTGQPIDLRKIRDLVGHVSETTGRASRMLESLLELSRAPDSGVPTVPTDLEDILADAISDTQCQATATGATITYSALPTLNCNPTLMKSVFQNLLGNAMLYVGPDVKPRIDITADRSGTICTLVISDNGIGIVPEQCEKVFEPMHRLHGPDGAYPGSGLGLAICRKIVLAHGGTITADSAAGGGTQFIITLPIHNERHSKAGTPGAPTDLPVFPGRR